MPRALPILGVLLLLSAVVASLRGDPPPAVTPTASPAETPLSPDQEKFFESKVRPLLVTKCLSCHGPTKKEASLRLDSRAALLKGGDSGEPVALPGQPDKSRLILAVRRQGDLKMPPPAKDKLEPAEIEILAQWVQQGLPWPKASQTVTPTPAELYAKARTQHWSLQPIRRPALPNIKTPGWASSPLDYFIAARLDAAGLAPSAPADRRVLLRRVTLDLTGLPPTPEETAAFLADTQPDAYERLVDRLLASPRYGERWGRHWLDVARYSDTRGYAFQRDRRFPYAYTYRDYVIRSFNADLPYDRFLLEQLAADKLPPQPDSANLAGLGFLTIGRKFDNQPEDIDEQIDVVCRGLLGLTAGCARCHDHKFDPIPSEDYYSLYGVFASCDQPTDNLPVIGDPHATPGYDEFAKELEKRRAAVAEVANQCRAKAQENGRVHVTDYLARIVSPLSEDEFHKLPFLALKGEDFKPKLVERWRRFQPAHAHPGDPLLGPWAELTALPDNQFAALAPPLLAKFAALPTGNQPGQINGLLKAALAGGEPIKSKVDLAVRYGRILQDAYAEYKKAGANPEGLAKLPPDAQPLVHLLLDPGTPCDIPPEETRAYFTRVDSERERDLQKKVTEHEAGSPAAPPRAMIVRDRAQPVEPHVFLRGKPDRPGKQVPRQFLYVVAGETRKPFQQGSGRLELAQAIVAPENPLTARVIVNRLWQHHFGRALVNTPSDFGLRSDPPSHPELLDYLAHRLRESGWSIKSLQREIVLSSTYRQTSAPTPRSEQAEKLDPENRLLWRMNRQRLEFETLRDSLYFVAGNLRETMYGRASEIVTPEFRRRTIYGFIDRQDLPNLLRVFDFASPDSSSPGRPHTIVPQQSLFLMNSPIAIAQAQLLAARPDVASLADPAQRITRLSQILYARDPSPAEIQLALEFIQAAAAEKLPAKLNPWEQYTQLLLLSSEFSYTD